MSRLQEFKAQFLTGTSLFEAVYLTIRWKIGAGLYRLARWFDKDVGA
jgi:hypothetical protein